MTSEECERIRELIGLHIPLLDDAEREALLRVMVGPIDSGPHFIAARTETVAIALRRVVRELREMPP